MVSWYWSNKSRSEHRNIKYTVDWSENNLIESNFIFIHHFVLCALSYIHIFFSLTSHLLIIIKSNRYTVVLCVWFNGDYLIPVVIEKKMYFCWLQYNIISHLRPATCVYYKYATESNKVSKKTFIKIIIIPSGYVNYGLRD